MKQNDFRGIAMAVVVFALGIIAVVFTGCDFLEDFVKMQGAELKLITDLDLTGKVTAPRSLWDLAKNWK
ncbi:MAG: hypothetical protein LBT00_16475 [Spirochaetaceae bacterium]|jgi:hypothetical protein|nr:hypothetical protein [Spirochaetaceae bacterium]